MKETGITGKRRSTTIAATPDDGKSQRKRRGKERLMLYIVIRIGAVSPERSLRICVGILSGPLDMFRLILLGVFHYWCSVFFQVPTVPCNSWCSACRVQVAVSNTNLNCLFSMFALRRRYTIRFARAEPCDCPVHRPIVTCGVLVECSGPMKIG